MELMDESKGKSYALDKSCDIYNIQIHRYRQDQKTGWKDHIVVQESRKAMEVGLLQSVTAECAPRT